MKMKEFAFESLRKMFQVMRKMYLKWLLVLLIQCSQLNLEDL